MKVSKFYAKISLALTEGTDTQVVHFDLERPVNCGYEELGERIAAELIKGLDIVIGKEDLSNSLKALAEDVAQKDATIESMKSTIAELKGEKKPKEVAPGLLADDDPPKKKTRIRKSKD